MKKKILFIINPISGKQKQKGVEVLIKQILDTNLYDSEITYTKAAKHAIELSAQGVKEGFAIITAVGGDGSVNEVGRSLVGTNSALAILPCGSGNGAARHMRIPSNLKQAIQVINKSNTKTIDTIQVNKEIAINVTGIGYAAHIANEFTKLKSRGFLNYVMLAVRDSISYKTLLCEIETNGEKKTVDAFIIDVANGSQWGNNVVIAPKAVNNDGVLDLCIIKKFPFLAFPAMATRLFTHSIDCSTYVENKQVTEVILRQERTLGHIDGEPIELGRELKVKINPVSLKVIIP